VQTVQTLDAPRHDAADVDARLRNLAQGAVASGVAPGIGLALHWQGEATVGAAGYAVAPGQRPLGASHRFPIGCIVKPLLALVCAELHERAAFDLEAPIEAYLPELGKTGITAAHLLSSTGGYVESDFGSGARLDWPGLAERFIHRRQAFRPGQVFSYTQSGHVIVGRIVERLTGRDALALIDEMILRPLDMAPVSFHDPSAAARLVRAHLRTGDRWTPFMPGETPLWRLSISPMSLDVADLLKLARLLGGDLLPPAISPAAYKRFAAPRVTVPVPSGGPLRERTPQAVGLGLLRYGRLCGHNGSYVGASCTLRFDPQTGTGLATAANARHTSNLNSRLFEELTGETGFDTPVGAALDVDIDRLEGEYQALMIGFGRATLKREGDELCCRFESPLAGPSEARLWRTSDGRLKGRAADPSAAFAIAPDPETGQPYLRSGVVAYARVAP